MNIKLYEIITQRIIGLMELGAVSLHKSWSVSKWLPRNLVAKVEERPPIVFATAQVHKAADLILGQPVESEAAA